MKQSYEDFKIRFDYNNMMKEFVGDGGITFEEIESMEQDIKKAHREIIQKRQGNVLGFMQLPYQQQLAKEIMEFSKSIKEKIDNFVVLGIGGSALGNIALNYAINKPYYNLLTKEQRKGCPRLFVLDNIDPEFISGFLEILDLEKTAFNVITKSGGTSETMSSFMVFRKALIDKIGEQRARDRIIVTTDSKKGSLLEISKKYGYKAFYIPENVGGRFSVLSPVGLLSAAVCGIDIMQLLDGAKYMDEICKGDDVFKNPAYMNGLLHHIAMKKDKNISVMMPYSQSLKYISDWYSQLWAESLGKKYDIKGNIVNTGQTPVKALGVTDQHSQIQLYNEGPNDKVITFIRVENFEDTVEIPNMFEDMENVSYLGGHTMNQLINYEQRATEIAVTKSGKLNCTIILPEINEFTIGQLLYMFELETAFVGELLQINAFDQPGVEEGKNATYAMMGRPGYQDKKAELDNMPRKKSKYII
ncbi:MAG: glucose-6-phosphate isomerase [Clostridia bacterium]|nr:glucose-6-phosphate isomerase [Clostridia bacterium]